MAAHGIGSAIRGTAIAASALVAANGASHDGLALHLRQHALRWPGLRRLSAGSSASQAIDTTRTPRFGGQGARMGNPPGEVWEGRTPMIRKYRRANSADVIDYFGDRQICDHCGATVSTYGDKCSVRLDVRCEGFETYERMLTATQEAMP